MRITIQVAALCTLLSVSASAQLRGKLAIDSMGLHSVEQHEPCRGQLLTTASFFAAYRAARVVRPAELVGQPWVAVGYSDEKKKLNTRCKGLTRGPAFEVVLSFDSTFVDIDAIGHSPPGMESLRKTKRGERTFTFDDSGDDNLSLTCRMSARGTLLCMSAEKIASVDVELMRIPVDYAQRFSYYSPIGSIEAFIARSTRRVWIAAQSCVAPEFVSCMSGLDVVTRPILRQLDSSNDSTRFELRFTLIAQIAASEGGMFVLDGRTGQVVVDTLVALGPREPFNGWKLMHDSPRVPYHQDGGQLHTTLDVVRSFIRLPAEERTRLDAAAARVR